MDFLPFTILDIFPDCKDHRVHACKLTNTSIKRSHATVILIMLVIVFLKKTVNTGLSPSYYFKWKGKYRSMGNAKNRKRERKLFSATPCGTVFTACLCVSFIRRSLHFWVRVSAFFSYFCATINLMQLIAACRSIHTGELQHPVWGQHWCTVCLLNDISWWAG